MSSAVPEGRYAWVQVVRGAVELNAQPLSAGDGAATEERALRLKATEPSEVLVFDLA
jgi:quercetin 2,3-dioxygenase